MMVAESKLKLDAVSVQCYDSHHFDERNSDDWFYDHCFVVDYFHLDLKTLLFDSLFLAEKYTYNVR